MRNRRYKRAEAPGKFQIAWQCPGVREVCPATDLNHGGVFLVSPQPQPVGTTLKMKIPNLGGDISVNGMVRNSTGAGMGVEFVAIGNKERAKLDLIVKRMLLEARAAESTEEKNAAEEEEIDLTAELSFAEAAAKNRRYIRINLPKGLKVAWMHGGFREVTIAGTVGLGGLFVITEKPAEVGTTIRLLFDIPGGEVLATATVRSQAHNRGMGVEFTEIRPEDRARLDQLLKRLVK